MTARLLLFLLLFTAGLGGCVPEDDWVDPTGDDDDPADDDDSFQPIPVSPGPLTGISWGVLSYTGAGEYPCDGSADLEVAEDLTASGSVDCSFLHDGQTCSLTFAELALDSGPQDFDLECYGSGDSRIQLWGDRVGAVNGRWQRLGEVISVEISWRATPPAP
ncbi:MAG: hypothetical protein VX498_03560 [Myxococcota bacterium]|nr:hypothetical protein [Myxococcota bacterium]